MNPTWKVAALYLLLCFVSANEWAFAQTFVTSPGAMPVEKPVGASVMFSGEPLFTLYDRAGSFSPQERATAVAQRLSRLAKESSIRVEAITTLDGEQGTEIAAGEMVILVVTDGDARSVGRARQAVAEDYALKIRQALRNDFEQTSLRTISSMVSLPFLIRQSLLCF